MFQVVDTNFACTFNTSIDPYPRFEDDVMYIGSGFVLLTV